GIVSQSTTATSGSWVVTTALANNQTYQVKVRQKDSATWSNWTTVGWLKTVVEITNTSRVSAGTSFSIAVQNDGMMQAWGDGSVGQLGDGLKNQETTSVQVLNLSDVASAQAGTSHVVALKKDGTVWTWGYNGSSQLGDASSTNQLLPMQVIRGLSDIQMVAAGDSHTVALKNDGTVWAWGLNNWGQIGIGTIGIEGVPKQVWYISGVSAVAAGSLHTLALKSDGTVWAWGSNDSGELGNGSKQTAYVPTQISGLSGVKQIYAKGSTNFAIKADGTVWAWGSNNVGQLGNGSTVNVPTPVQIGINNVASIAPGGSHTLAVKNDGTVWAWGSNNVGQIGNGSIINVSTPVQVSGLSGITSAAAAMDGHSVVLKNDGTMWSWGLNTYGQLGDGTVTNRLTAVQVQKNVAPTVNLTWPLGTQVSPTVATTSKPTIAWSLSDAANTVFTSYQVQVLDASGLSVVDSGIVSQSTTATSGSWVVTTALASNQTYQVKMRQKDSATWSNWTTVGWLKTTVEITNTSRVSAGTSFSIAVQNDGMMQAWGDGSVGQLGDGLTNRETTSVQVLNLSDVASAQAGASHVVALKKDGTVWTWGYNGSSQLGDASSTNRLLPVQVIRGLSDIQMVAAGDNHTVALKNDGTVWAWGLNNCGQIGIGTTGIEGAPKQVWYISGVSAVAAGSLHTLALKSDGTVWAWGYNGSGELGNGSKQTAYVPTQISGLSGVKQIYTKGSTNFAIKADGTVWAWGSNNVGQLGNGSTVNVPTPVQIGINNVASIAPGGSHTLAVKNDGTVWAWGSNNVGQIGNGSTINVSTPVQVSGLSGITSAAAAMDG
ncbi:RCC1 repeat-containing protein, partial [Paenibacillus alba]|uniref:RCC1 domain-containing protein n=1 Tax=Paenibacillus alba TaxID=1197127 RepID=UPI003B8480BB|nr:RCC1 repeat-containing protein [Paenibacillus alba]